MIKKEIFAIFSLRLRIFAKLDAIKYHFNYIPCKIFINEIKQIRILYEGIDEGNRFLIIFTSSKYFKYRKIAILLLFYNVTLLSIIMKCLICNN